MQVPFRQTVDELAEFQARTFAQSGKGKTFFEELLNVLRPLKYMALAACLDVLMFHNWKMSLAVLGASSSPHLFEPV
jgi:hypothetical protein